jgi:hypothetical protein
MAAPSQQQEDSSSAQQTGIYVYGIFAGDIEVTESQSGVGDPPGELRVVRSNGLAALVSEVDTARPLGTPEDLTTHKEILDASAAEMPVLPIRFGAVLASEDAVISELLEEHRDEFTQALDELDGCAEYVVKGRYVEEAILEEVLSESKEAAQLREELRGKDPDTTRDARIRLGEILNEAIEAKRAADTRTLGDRMDGHCVASLVRDPGHEMDAVHVAFLLQQDQEEDMQEAVAELGREWEGRVELRTLGPMAAYDFVGTAQPES